MKRSKLFVTLLALLAFGTTAWAQDNTIDLSTVTGDITVTDGTILTGTLNVSQSVKKISIADGATVTLSGVTIGSSTLSLTGLHAGLTCLGDATLILADGTTNSVYGFHVNYPGIYVPTDKTLTIQGSGTLHATGRQATGTGNGGSAGIGGGYQISCGNIVINGGNINARGYSGSAGIGGGKNASCGSITINNGDNVDATGGYQAAGIGAGYNGTCGSITIGQGSTKVIATKGGSSAPYSIGRGEGSSSCGTVTIGNGHTGEISTSPFTYYQYTVQFNANGGSGSMSSILYEGDLSSPQSLTNSFTAPEGGSFFAWNTISDGTGVYYYATQDVNVIAANPGETVMLYARWRYGNGTESNPYQIHDISDWLLFASYINEGNTDYNSKYYKLMEYIMVEETIESGDTPAYMWGTSETNSFQGTFDGNNQTLTVIYADNRMSGSNNDDIHYCGPFRFINGATIKNLHVTGEIYKKANKHAGGFVGKAYGTNTIQNCRCSVDIRSNTDGDGSHGGFLGDLREGTTTFENCVFDGKLRGRNEYTSDTDYTLVNIPSATTKWGGFVGWVASGCTANFNYCLYAPAEINIESTSESRTFARKDGSVNITNGYYTETLGSADGKKARSISGEANVTVTSATAGINVFGTIFYYDNNAVKHNNMLYSGKNEQVNLSITSNPDPNYNGYVADYGTLIGSNNPYLLTMPDDNVTILRAAAEWQGTGHRDFPYLIYNAAQWGLLAERVNNGTSTYAEDYFKLMADIMVEETISSGNPTKMVGRDKDKSFRGEFDGNGHTITVNYHVDNGTDYCAPFRIIYGATIRNLHVTGSIYTNSGKHTAGIVGQSYGTSYITTCRSSVDILSNKDGDGSHGGIVGDVRNDGLYLDNNDRLYVDNCLFDGKLRTNNSRTTDWGGLIGWVTDTHDHTEDTDSYHDEDSPHAYLSECMFNPTEVSNSIINNGDSRTFGRGSSGRYTFRNCYYKTLIQNAQGNTNAQTFDNDTLCTALHGAWEVFNDTVAPIISQHPLNGQGTADSPYQINSLEDWHAFASNVFAGEDYSDKYLELTTDITTSRMVGYHHDRLADEFPSHKSDAEFSGTFNGNGHTLTFNRTNKNYNESYCAPFCNVKGATIENLNIEGTINTSHEFAAGVIARANGSESPYSDEHNLIKNCHVSITINSSFNGEGTHGGIIANALSSINNRIEGCLFDGKLLGPNTTHCGGFVGYSKVENASNKTVYIDNCWFAPTELTMSTTGAQTFARVIHHNGDPFYPIITNCYYTQVFGQTQGKLSHGIVANNNVAVEGANDRTVYDISGITSFSSGLVYGNVFYAGQDDNLNLKLIPPTGYSIVEATFTPEGGTATIITPDEDGVYSYTMPNANVTINTTIVITPWEGDGSEETPYLIYYPTQLDLLATRVNDGTGADGYSGTYFKLMDDINYTYNGNNESNYTAIGDFSHYFRGHFDGNNHTVSGIRIYKYGSENSDWGQGLFGCIGEGGEVKNLTLNDAYIAGHNQTGGIVGRFNGAAITNCNVTSSVTIRSVQAYSVAGHGGIVGLMLSGTVSHCTSAATLTNENGGTCQNFGGITGEILNAGCVLSDNLAIGVTVPASNVNKHGAILGSGASGMTLTHNYYANCTVAGDTYDIGCNNHNVTTNDGAVPGYFLTLGENITSSASVFTIPAHGDTDEVTYNVAARYNTITLGYEPSNYVVTYYIDNVAINGNTFTMPNRNVTVSAQYLGISKVVSGYVNSINPDGGYVLIASPVGTVSPTNVTHMLDNEYDLYAFDQNASDGKEWRNYEVHTFNLEPGQGYLYANSDDVTLVFPGTPYNGDGEVTLSKTTGAEWEGWNLVGNPFNDAAYIDREFYTMNGDGSEIIAAEVNSIAPMEGIFVIANSDGETLTFTTEPANNGKAMLALNVSQGRGVIDRAIVRFGEGGLLPKFQIRHNSTKVFIPQNGNDYAVVRGEAQGNLPVSFKAKEDGTYTLSLGSEDMAFSYLHLIDNMTGNDVDLLQMPSYSFEAKTTDYESRFKLVFATKDGPSTGSETFAFISNGNILVNGEGTLQVIDMTGRIIVSHGGRIQCVPTNGMPAGVYVLRLINGNDVKTQKIVIE